MKRVRSLMCYLRIFYYFYFFSCSSSPIFSLNSLRIRDEVLQLNGVPLQFLFQVDVLLADFWDFQLVYLLAVHQTDHILLGLSFRFFGELKLFFEGFDVLKQHLYVLFVFYQESLQYWRGVLECRQFSIASVCSKVFWRIGGSAWWDSWSDFSAFRQSSYRILP